MYQLGLIGYPIKHSLSPWIHEHFLKKTNLSGSYDIIEISLEENFSERIQQLRDQQIDGFNITVPYKQTIIPYLDELDANAKRIGAVNTVVLKDGKWIGYNTDGIGYVRSLEEAYPELFTNKSSRVLLLGAGGAARGIYDALTTSGFTYVDLANRTLSSAEEIAELKLPHTETKTFTLQEAEARLAEYDVIIQTTSVGMKPHIDKMVISLNHLKPETIVSDIVYQPLETTFLKTAQAKGAKIHYGHTMLLYQAQYAFEIWTNQQVEVGDMDEQLKSILEGR